MINGQVARPDSGRWMRARGEKQARGSQDRTNMSSSYLLPC